ncbi:MAG TPA: hypothetical protein PLB90_09105 [Opitutaceae bacterium]|nr:hypothetical protein [Opitutaceae bacterium]
MNCLRRLLLASLASLATGANLPAQTYTFSRLAGSSPAGGWVDGKGAAARFNRPSNLAVDRNGNIFVIDQNGSVVRKVDPSGNVTTFASKLQVNGRPSRIVTPNFNGASGITFDASGTLYFGARVVSKVDASGNIVDIAGSAVFPAQPTDGVGSAARFVNPESIVADAAGNLYLTDTTAGTGLLQRNSYTVRKITPDGTVTTLAGTFGQSGDAEGQGAAARFQYPTGIAVDRAGNVYVADTGNRVIRKITPTGFVTTFAGTHYLDSSAQMADGLGPAARFYFPKSLAMDSAGTLFVGDNSAIRKITPDGMVTTLAGNVGGGYPATKDGNGANANFSGIAGLAVDSAGNVYVSESGGNVIRKVTPAGDATTLAGATSAPVATDGFGSAASLDGAIIAIDREHNVYLNGSAVRKVTPAGNVTTLFRPNATVLARDSAGNFYGVGDRTLLKFSPDGIQTFLAGMTGVAGGVDGVGTAARIGGPQAMTIGVDGTVYFGDTFTIRKMTLDGRVSTVAGKFFEFGSVDGVGSSARFRGPSRLVVDRAGNIFVNDDDKVRRITPDGTVTTLFTGSLIASAESDDLYATTTYGYLSVYRGPLGSNLPVPETYGVRQPGSANWVDDLGRIYVIDDHVLQIGVRDAMPGRLSNLSCRALAGPDAQALIVGFVVDGGSRQVLLRGVGPTLASFGVAGALTQTQLALVSADQTLGENHGWDSNGNGAALRALASQVGAFALPAHSADAALAANLPSGVYLEEVSGASRSSGVVLGEIYDADAASTPGRLVNVSARCQVGTGDAVSIVGFVVTGDKPIDVLIRGVGPGLKKYGVTGTLATPQLDVYSDGTRIATNTGWETAADVAELPYIAAQVGAFPLETGSADDAIFLTLRPGTYTAQVRGQTGATGIALLELYEVPPLNP